MELKLKTKETIKKFPKKLFISTEVVDFLLLMPITGLILSFIFSFNFNKTLFITGMAFLFGLLGLLFSYFIFKLEIKPLNRYLNKLSNNEPTSENEYRLARNRLFILSRSHSIQAALKWIIFIPIAFYVFSLTTEIYFIVIINVFTLFAFNITLSGFYYFMMTEKIIRPFFAAQLFVNDPKEGKKMKGMSLSFFVSGIPIMISILILLLVTTIIINTNFLTLKKTYINQMKNLSVSIDRNITNKFEEIELLSKNKISKSFFQKSIKNIQIGNSGYPLITDKNLLILAHPDKSLINTSLLKYPFGKKIANGKKTGIVEYPWRGNHKVLYYIKNKKYGFISISTGNYKDINKSLMLSIFSMLIFMIAGIPIIGFIIFILVRAKLTPLKNYQIVFQNFSKGNLISDFKVYSNDEVGIISYKLKLFVEKLSEILQNIQGVSNEIASASEEMTNTTGAFTDNAQTQAASAEEITATVEELSAGVENIANSSLQQFNMLSNLMENINSLSTVIDQMNNEITETVNLTSNISHRATEGEKLMKEMNGSMANITKSSKEMINVVSIINDISDQINLLALNASIEAARAGEAGKGFAVVAEEISKLADQTATSIGEIDQFIKSNDNEIKNGMQIINKTIEAIGTITEGVTVTEKKMNVISDKMKNQLETNSLVNRVARESIERSNQIKNATEEQKHATIEIVKSIGIINELTQSNATGSEEMAANAHGVANLAEDLKINLNFFKFKNKNQ